MKQVQKSEKKIVQTLGGSKLSKNNELGDGPGSSDISATRSFFWRGLAILQTKNKKYMHTYIHTYTTLKIFPKIFFFYILINSVTGNAI